MIPAFLRPLILLLALMGVLPAADSPSLAASVPDGAVAFVEVSNPGALVRRVQQSQLLEWALASDEFQTYEKSEDYRKFRTFRAAAELMLGAPLWDVAAELLSGRIAVAVYSDPDNPRNPRFVALARLEETKSLGRVRDALKPLLSAGGRETDTTAVCPGSTTWEFRDKGFVSLHGTWIAAAQDRALLERTLGFISDRPHTAAPLAKQENFAAMDRSTGSSHLVRAWVNTPLVMKAIGPRFGLPQKFDDGMASLLFGGLVELAGRSPFAAATLDVGPNAVEGELTVAGDPDQLPAPAGLWFTRHPENGVIALPKTPGTIAGLTIHRKLGEWYRHRGSLLTDRLLPAFDKFETDIGNLLPQKDFGEDVLPLIGDNFTLTAALQSYDHLGGQPGIKLPAFALIFDLPNPKDGADTFQLFFQTLASILNLQAGQEGRQPSVMDTELYHDTKITWSRFLAKPEGDRLPVAYNFQPAAAAAGRKYIIATSVQYCRDLVDHFKNPEASRWRNHHSDLNLDLTALTKLAQLNEGLLRSQEIQKGAAPDAAEKRIALLLQLLGRLDAVNYQSTSADGLLKMQLRTSWK